MTAKEFKSKGFDDLREGLYHVFEQDEIELLLNEFAALPCSCEGGQLRVWSSEMLRIAAG